MDHATYILDKIDSNLITQLIREGREQKDFLFDIIKQLKTHILRNRQYFIAIVKN